MWMSVNGVEVGTASFEGEELAVIRESESGLLFALDASYVEQDVGPIVSPHGNGCITLDNDQSEFFVVTGRMYGDDDDLAVGLEVEPGEDAADRFRQHLAAANSDDGLVPDPIPDDGPGAVFVTGVYSLRDLFTGRRNPSRG
jgi:hypothetical protein